MIAIFVFLFQPIVPRFWHTEEFSRGAEAFLLASLTVVILGLVVVAAYAVYFVTVKWGQLCKTQRAWTTRLEERMALQREMDEMALNTFRDELNSFRTDRVPLQPFKGATPSSSLMREIDEDLDMGIMMRAIEATETTKME